LRPRSALSSAQVLPEWILSTAPCNAFSANGDNPLNSLSHSRGAVQGEEEEEEEEEAVGREPAKAKRRASI
jgi:hypothetical protein